MIADDTRMVAVRAVILGMNRSMKDRPHELGVSPVERGSPGRVADLEGECFLQGESAGKLLRDGEIQLRGMLSGGRGRNTSTPVTLDELTKRFLGIDRKSVQQRRKVDRPSFGACSESLEDREVAADRQNETRGGGEDWTQPEKSRAAASRRCGREM
ncbi:MAG: hypothetical protein SF069_07240 [Phycisphaerae bacterium]|nr:hypothetical protein [Phycisphaerae bacterium]